MTHEGANPSRTTNF